MTHDAYLKDLAARLQTWGAELAQLEAKAHDAPVGVRLMYQRWAAAFRHHLEEVEQQQAALQAASEEGWPPIQQAAEDACDRMALAEMKLLTVHPML